MRSAHFIIGSFAVDEAKGTTTFITGGIGTTFVHGARAYTLGENGLMASADVSGVRFCVDEDLH